MSTGHRVFQRATHLLLSTALTIGAAAPAFATTASAADTGEVSAPKTIKVACVGASTTVGVGSEDGTSYPSDLQTMLGGLCEVRNFGYSGCTVVKNGRDTASDTPGKWAYIGSDIHQQSLDFQADVVLIMMGGNDSKPVNWNNGDNTFKADYEELVRSYLEQGNEPTVILSTSTWIQKEQWGINEATVSGQIIPIQKEIGQKLGLPVVNMRDVTFEKDTYYSSDGVHLSSAGYAAVAQAFYDAMQEKGVVPENSRDYLSKPSAVSFNDIYGEYDGFEVLQWANGQKGYFHYANGALASALGLEKGTVVDKLTITVTYFWDAPESGNDWMHFNTNDQDGLSAPGVANDNPHDNGFGTFAQYGMTQGKWTNLVVSRDQQKLGSGSADWTLNVGDLNAAHSFYIRGFEIAATLSDETVKRVRWGAVKEETPVNPDNPVDPYEPITDFSDRKMVKIACVGASTTEGNNGYSYPAFLQAMLGGRCEVRNFGYPGCSVIKNKQYSYIGSKYYTDSLAYQADIVIIAMGGNDSQPPLWNNGNNTFQEDYDELVNAYRQQGNHPLILISNGGTVLKPSWGIDDSVIETKIMPIQREIAEKYDLPIVNFREVLLGHDEYFIEDGVHYTAAGYKAMATLYYDKLMTIIKLPDDGAKTIWNPTAVSFNDIYGEFDGYSVMKWEKGQTGSFQYGSGSIAAALGIEEGTVLKNLTITVSYYWDQKGAGGDWMHFNTNDKDGLSAPGISNGNPHDNGFGGFTEYGLIPGKWSKLTVSRDEQMLGASGAADWTLNIGSLAAESSFYINGFEVAATLADGTAKNIYWGASKPVTTADTKALEEAIAAAMNDAELAGFTDKTAEAYKQALTAAKDLLKTAAPTQEAVDGALEALLAAEKALIPKETAKTGDINGDGKIDTTDARLALQYAVGKITLTEAQQAVGDVNGDSKVDTTDARLILQKAVGKIDTFPTAK